ncbi:MAG: HNH endonuclease [Candidatus Hodarchaeota archaeon]
MDKNEILDRINFLKDYLAKMKQLGENLDNNDLKEYLGFNCKTIQSYLIDGGLEKKKRFFDRTPDFTDIPSYLFVVKDKKTYDFYFIKLISVLNHYIRVYEDLYEKYDERKTEIKGVISELEEALEKNILDAVLKGLTRDHDSPTRKVPAQRREYIIRRDEQTCQICGDFVDDINDIEIDHIFPYSLGGTNEQDNLMVTHSKCNKDKGKKLEYYNSEEGRLKLELNIKYFVRDLPIIQNFVQWLKNSRDKRKKT